MMRFCKTGTVKIGQKIYTRLKSLFLRRIYCYEPLLRMYIFFLFFPVPTGVLFQDITIQYFFIHNCDDQNHLTLKIQSNISLVTAYNLFHSRLKVVKLYFYSTKIIENY